MLGLDPEYSVMVAYAATMLASAAMNSLFVTYYIDMFMRVTKVQNGWFYFGQTIFLLWNAMNDPLFGWISDKRKGQRRLPAIKWCGTIWALAFIMTWFPWMGGESDTLNGLHFVTTLCFYDGMLTAVEVTHQALLSDLTSCQEKRTQLNAASAGGALLGSMSSFIGHIAWDSTDPRQFQRLSIIVGIGSVVAFWVTALNIDEPPHQGELEDAERDDPEARKPEPNESFLSFIKNAFMRSNFRTAATFSFIQSFDCTFEKNFFCIFVELLLGRFISPATRAFMVSASFVLPHLCVVLMSPLTASMGAHAIITRFLYVRVVMASIVICFGRWNLYVISVYILVNRVVSEMVCRLFPLVLTELSDEDMKVNRRKRNMSGMITGTMALLTKPSQSLAPMLGWLVLSTTTTNTSDAVGEPTGDSTVFFSACCVPLLCAVMQICVWSRYRPSVQRARYETVEEVSLDERKL